MGRERDKLDRAARPEIHRERNRIYNLRRLYGMTSEEFDQKRADQDYRCASCNRHESEIPPRKGGRPRASGEQAVLPPLVIDHCHRSGRVRKLLCDRCNRIAGMAGDDAELLMSVVRYLRVDGAE